MSLILVTPLSAMLDTLRAYQPSRLVSMLSPEYMIDTPPGFSPERHLRLALNDIADPALGTAPPMEQHVEDLIEFGRDWDAADPMLIHCWAGVSRSMAAAFVLLCDRSWRGAEFRIAREMRGRAPHASPNRLFVRLADEILERNGAMMRAIDAMGPAVAVEEGEPVELPFDVFGL
jgi:predicted protein tyrosine phosphatase